MENFIMWFISIFIVFVFVYIAKRDEEKSSIPSDLYYEIWDNSETIDVINDYINNLTVQQTIDILNKKVKQREDTTING